MPSWAVTLSLLLFAHYLFDFVLQGEFLALGKNPLKPLPGIPWYHCMLAHVFLHSVAVAFIMGHWQYGVIEFWVHLCSDLSKCQGEFRFNEDQAVHIVIKLIYIALMVGGWPR